MLKGPFVGGFTAGGDAPQIDKPLPQFRQLVVVPDPGTQAQAAVQVDVNVAVSVVGQVVVEGGLDEIPLMLAEAHHREVDQEILQLLSQGDHQVRPVKEGDLALVVYHMADDGLISRDKLHFLRDQSVMALLQVTGGKGRLRHVVLLLIKDHGAAGNKHGPMGNLQLGAHFVKGALTGLQIVDQGIAADLLIILDQPHRTLQGDQPLSQIRVERVAVKNDAIQMDFHAAFGGEDLALQIIGAGGARDNAHHLLSTVSRRRRHNQHNGQGSGHKHTARPGRHYNLPNPSTSGRTRPERPNRSRRIGCSPARRTPGAAAPR